MLDFASLAKGEKKVVLALIAPLKGDQAHGTNLSFDPMLYTSRVQRVGFLSVGDSRELLD